MKCPNCGFENPEGFEFCGKCGTALTEAEEADPRQALLDSLLPQALRDKIQASGTIEPERRPVTVLFADLSGFTALGEKLDPEELTALTNECLEAMVKSVFKYEGFVDKLIGDAVMALFGAPVAHEDDPERALRCALEMQQAIAEIASALSDLPEASLSIHAGVHTGDVVAGPVGPDLRLDYSVMGDTVNLASRLSDTAESGQILASRDLHRLTQHAFGFEDVLPLNLKGIDEEVEAHLLLGLRAEPEPARGIRGLSSPLVGREKEFEILQIALQDLLEGKGQIVTVMGEPGIGKSRLVEELQQTAVSSQGAQVTWLEGRSLSYGATIAYWPLLQMLRAWAQIRDEDPEAQAVRKLRLALRALLPDQIDDTFPFLAMLLSLRLDEASEEKVKYLDAEALQTRIFVAVQDWVAALAQQQALVLVFEDLHWADPSTVAQLSHLLSSTEDAPVMLLLVARPERERAWWEVKAEAERDYAHRAVEISLSPLTEEDSDTLVRNLLTIEDLPKGIKSTILEKTEGNPFFVEEIIRALIDEGVIVRQNGSWRATTKILALDVPDTLQGVILARIDRLPPQPRGLLQKASVIGRTFLYRILAFVADGDRQLREPLTRLQQVELIQEKTRRPELEYIFKHTLTQEVAYGTLVQDTRKDTHARVAQAIESLFPDRLEEFYGLLAHHYSGAEDREKAVEYLIKAGDRAKAAYANREAIEFYRHAHELLEDREVDDDRRRDAALLVRWGQVHDLLTEFDEAIDVYIKAANLSRQLGEHEREAEIHFAISWSHGYADRSEEAAASAKEGLEIAERIQADPALVARGYIALCRPLFWGGLDQKAGYELAQKALPLLEEAGDPKGIGDAYRMLGLMGRGTLDTRLEYPLKAAEKHLQAGDLVHAAIDYNNVAVAYNAMADFDKALEYIKKGIEGTQKTGAMGPYGYLLTTLSEIHVYQGNFDEAQASSEEGLQLAHKTRDRQLEAYCEAGLGWIAGAQGDWEKCVDGVRRGLGLRQFLPPYYLVENHRWLGVALVMLGQLDEAETVLKAGMSLTEAMIPGDAMPLRGVLQRALGSLHSAREDWDQAKKAFQESLAIWEELKDPGIQRSETLRDYGLMLRRRGEEGDDARGREMLRDAIQFFRQKGVQFDLVWTERQLAKLGLSLKDFET